MKLLDAQKRRQNIAVFKYLLSRQSKTTKVLGIVALIQFTTALLGLTFLGSWHDIQDALFQILFVCSGIFLGMAIEELRKILKESGKI